MYKRIGLYLFAGLFISAGLGHFLLDHFFINALPEWTPFPLAIVYLSGIIEILLALCLLYLPTRRKAGIYTAIFLVLIFPVNIYMALTPEDYNLPSLALWIRLPMQFGLIWWVLSVSKYQTR
ncbi:DoxX family protein [Aquibacillus rhizosphaerae]|uniref:Methylamine utilisation protein MauE domain-containing protein n=1 Tax=Aquibacillus rhizosphaerae TaxID=3051431 RepID=A0ABT7L5A5_9BACI|nr:MauE/DoxX family redox-associated membrane protein [Aquibacillus sp. LR5S19]MDL4840574.1 hypothetical protein [Aquibacillus sp. LR5S19]